MREGTDTLVELLLANDRQKVYDTKKELVEPTNVIEELVRRKESVIPQLIRLIERYEMEKERRNYIDYVIEILGRIGSERAIELILRILLATLANDDDSCVSCGRWLGNCGKAAVPSVIRFVDANYQTTQAVGIAAEAMRKVRDKRLVPMLVNLLTHPASIVVQTALTSLQERDDPSVVPRIVPLLQYEDKAEPGEQRVIREEAIRALERLLRNDQGQLRKILVDNSILSVESVRELSKELVPLMDDLARSYDKDLIFDGDEGDQLTALIKEKVSRENSSIVLQKVARLLYHEGLIPNSQFEAIQRRCESFYQSARKIERENAEVFWIIGSITHSIPTVKMEKRQVRKSWFSTGPELVKRLRFVMHSRRFAVSEYHQCLLARSKDKSIIIDSWDAEGRKERNWSDVTISLCGEWEEHGAASMLEQLWRVIEEIPPTKLAQSSRLKVQH